MSITMNIVSNTKVVQFKLVAEVDMVQFARKMITLLLTHGANRWTCDLN